MRTYVFWVVPTLVLACTIFLALKGNHHAIDMRYSLPLLLLTAGLAPFFLTKQQRIAVVVYCISVYLAILLADQFNVLVEYTRWVKRGMPEAFTSVPFKQ